MNAVATTRERGALGERFACERLLEAGWELLARNWRSGRSEIDIIARRGEVIAFVEVKTRAENALTAPAGAVTTAQRRRIALAAAAYLKERGIYNTGEFQPRFDIFEVVTASPGSKLVTRFSHLEGAYDTGDLDVFI